MNKEILRLAVPNILSNISVPLLSTVDTALMGRLSEEHIGAVGLGAMIFNFIYWNFGFLRMGTTGLTAQAYGRSDRVEIATVLGRATVVVFSVALLILLLQVPFGQISFRLMNVSGSQYTLVEEYFFIRVWAAPATLASYALMGWFFGMQNAIYPLILTVVVNAVNIALSFYFVHHLGMDVDGVAWGTVIAQYVGLLLGSFLLVYRYRDYFRELQAKLVLQWTAFRQFLRINTDIFIRTLCLTFGFAFFYSQSASGGEMILAVNVILLQFLNWMSYGVDGFAFASESLIGKYSGARDRAQTYRAIRYSFAWGMGLALIYSLIYWFFGPALVRVFTDQVDVINATMPFLYWMAIFPILSTPCYIWDGVFIGLTASKAMRNTMLLAFGIYLASYYGWGQYEGNNGLWLALLIFMVARGVIQHLFFWKKGWEME